MGPLRGDNRADSPSSWLSSGPFHPSAVVHACPNSELFPWLTQMALLFFVDEITQTSQWNCKDIASWFFSKDFLVSMKE
jgi:hypothetical protein